MITLKLQMISLLVLGPCAYAYTCKEWSVGRTLPVVLCAQSLMLIVLGYVLSFSMSISILALPSFLGWLLVLARHKQFLRIKAIWDFWLPCAFMCCASVFLYNACSRRVYLSYDEYSHWGIIVKVISLFDELPRMGNGAAYIQYTYPPSAAIMPAVFSSVLGYRDGTAYLGYEMLILGLIVGLASKVSSGKRGPAVCAVVYLAMMAVFPLSILRLFTEPVIALLMALLIAGAYFDNTLIWEDMLYAAMLAMIKNTGLVYVLICLLVRVAIDQKWRSVTGNIALLGTSALCALSYKVYCNIQGIAATISPVSLGDNIRSLAEGTLENAYMTLPERFLRFFFTEKLPQAGIYASYGFGTCASVYALVLLLCAVHVCFSEDRKRAVRLWLGIWLGNTLYILLIIGSYYISFSFEEVARLAEADRYTMLPALLTAILACALLVGECAIKSPVRHMGVLLGLCTVLVPISHTEMTVHTFVTGEYVPHTIWARAEAERLAAFISEWLSRDNEEKILCLGDYEYEKLHYMLAGKTDIGRIDTQRMFSPWNGHTEQFEALLKDEGYTSVFVAGCASENAQRLIQMISSFLVDGDEKVDPYSLYRVKTEANGSIALQIVDVMSNQE